MKGTDPNWTGGAWVRPTPAPKPPRKRRNIIFSPLAWSIFIGSLLTIFVAVAAAAPPGRFDEPAKPKLKLAPTTTTTTIPKPKPKPAPAPVPAPKPKPVPEGKVVEVVDGDTIKAIVNGREETIRLIGIDTPETVHPSQPVECYGPEATKAAEGYLLGKRVRLEADPSQGDRDRYGRLLRYVFADGYDIGRELIYSGFATEYTYDGPYKYQKDYKAAEEFAQSNGYGMWSDKCKVKPAPAPAPAPAPDPSSPPSADPLQDKDCQDFATQPEAQAAHEQHPEWGLDGNDHDGIACESLPAA